MKIINKNRLLYTIATIVIIAIFTIVASRVTSQTIIRSDQTIPSSQTVIATTTVPVETITTDIQIKDTLYKFIEVMDGCSIHSEGACVNMRSGPGKDFPVVLGLRTGIVLNVEKTVTDSDGMEWHKIKFLNTLTYPERVIGDLYISASVVRTFYHEGNVTKINKEAELIEKKIVVNVTEQMLYAYDGDRLFMKEPVSTGLEDTPTKVGEYSIYKKTPSRYMQGASDGPADQYYDLPGVPWDLYFSYDGDVIHGAYWHNNFGKKWSHGCVNMEPQQAKKLYEWAIVGTPVIVIN